MYALNFFDTTATRNVLRALLLTAACVLGMLIAYYAAIVVLPLLVAALSAVCAVVVAAASAVLSAAAYAVTVALWCAVRMVVIVALVRALPLPWRAAVVVWAHRDGLLIVGKGLALAAVVVACFLGAILVAPLVLAVAGKIAVVALTMVGAVASVKVM